RVREAPPGEACTVLIGCRVVGPVLGPLLDALLRVCFAFRGLRRRGDLPLPLGRPLPPARRVWARRDGDLHRDPRGRAVLRVEEGRAQLVLTAPRPTIDLAAVRSDRKSVG